MLESIPSGPSRKIVISTKVGALADVAERPAVCKAEALKGRLKYGRVLQLALLCVATLTMIGASTSRFDHLGHEMICTCGCTQILLECNHVGCPVSPVMIGELQTRLAGPDNTDTLVLNWFAAKYGAMVLASPIRGGFDNVAWITPIAVFLFATVGTAVIVLLWKRRTEAAVAPGPAPETWVPATSAQAVHEQELRDRIRKETEY